MQAQAPHRPSQRRAGAALVLACLAAASAAHAADRASGECTLNGQVVKFIDGVAYHRPHAFDDKTLETVVTLAPFAIDKAAVARAEAKSKNFAVFSQAMAAPGGRASRLDLHVLDGKVVDMSFGGAASRMAALADAGVGHWKAVESASGISGTFRFDGDSQDDLKCSVSFEIAFAEGKPAG